jgi:GT2 family glycosyltransferase
MAKVTVVAAYNNQVEMTRDFLDTMQKHAPLLWNVHMILVNGGGPENIEHPFVDQRIDLETNEGFCKVLNAGLRAVPTDTDYVFFVGNDSFPVDDEWLPNLVKLQKHTEAWMVCPANDNPGMEAYKHLYKIHSSAAGLPVPYWEVDFFPSIAWLMPYDKFLQVGLLDERYIRTGMYADDDYCRRIKELGGKIVVSKHILLKHLLSAEGKALGTQSEDMRINYRLFKEKWK